MQNEEEKTKKCSDCRRELGLGLDAIGLDYGVIGPRGFVPLGEKKFFCDEDCLQRHVGGTEVVHLSRRIP